MSRPCNHAGCSVLVDKGYCAKHDRPAGSEVKADGSKRQTSHQRGYGGNWPKLRAYWLRLNPLCVKCQELGRVEAATDVDHIIAKSAGGSDDLANLQSLCHSHHSLKTAIEDGSFGNRHSDFNTFPAQLDLKPSKAFLTIVFGQPMVGKTCYARRQAVKTGARVIDLDNYSGISMGQALARRNIELTELAEASGNVVFTVSAPSATEREAWCNALQPIQALVLVAGRAVCETRARDRVEPYRSRSLAAIAEYWRQYSECRMLRVDSVTGQAMGKYSGSANNLNSPTGIVSESQSEGVI